MKTKDILIIRYVIFQCLDQGYRINTAKLEYLLILAQGYMAASKSKKLLDDDIIVPIVGRLELPSVERDYIYGIAGFKDKEQYEDNVELDSDVKEVLNSVISRYADFNLENLIGNTVLENLQKTYHLENQNNIIPFEVLKNSFIQYSKTYNFDTYYLRSPEEMPVTIDLTRKR